MEVDSEQIASEFEEFIHVLNTQLDNLEKEHIRTIEYGEHLESDLSIIEMSNITNLKKIISTYEKRMLELLN